MIFFRLYRPFRIGNVFQRLIVAKEDDLISVYLTEIVIKEVESKIYENVYEKVKNSHSKFVKDARVLRNIDKYKDIFNILVNSSLSVIP